MWLGSYIVLRRGRGYYYYGVPSTPRIADWVVGVRLPEDGDLGPWGPIHVISLM